MSDTEIIIHLLRNVEWRLRANRLLHELMLALSIVLTFLIVLKIWDLFSPFKAATLTFVIAACAFLFTSYVVWRLREKGTLDQAAVSVDQKAGLNDEIKTAFWFIKNPRSSEWIDGQIQRAARNARKVDVHRVYPGIIPRTSYTAAATMLVFVGLNFAPLPSNHTPSMVARKAGSLRNTPKGGSLELQRINAGLGQIAAHLQESEKLRGVAQALTEKRLGLAAEEFRKLAAQLGNESPTSLQDIRETLLEAARNSGQGLQTLAEDLAETAHALENTNMAAAQEAIEEVAKDFEDIEESIYDQESSLDQLARGNEQRAEQDGVVSGAPIPQPRNFPQVKSSTDSLGDSGGRTDGGPRKGPSTTLAVKLQQEGVKGMPRSGTTRVDVEQASRQERSKLDYRNVESELTAAQKDVLNHESMPWKYRPLIKNYFEAVPGPVKK